MSFADLNNSFNEGPPDLLAWAALICFLLFLVGLALSSS